MKARGRLGEASLALAPRVQPIGPSRGCWTRTSSFWAPPRSHGLWAAVRQVKARRTVQTRGGGAAKLPCPLGLLAAPTGDAAAHAERDAQRAAAADTHPVVGVRLGRAERVWRAAQAHATRKRSASLVLLPSSCGPSPPTCARPLREACTASGAGARCLRGRTRGGGRGGALSCKTGGPDCKIAGSAPLRLQLRSNATPCRPCGGQLARGARMRPGGALVRRWWHEGAPGRARWRSVRARPRSPPPPALPYPSLPTRTVGAAAR